MVTTHMEQVKVFLQTQVVEEALGMNQFQGQGVRVQEQELEVGILVNLQQCTVARCRDHLALRRQR